MVYSVAASNCLDEKQINFNHDIKKACNDGPEALVKNLFFDDTIKCDIYNLLLQIERGFERDVKKLDQSVISVLICFLFTYY
jgi:hypothetical protein